MDVWLIGGAAAVSTAVGILLYARDNRRSGAGGSGQVQECPKRCGQRVRLPAANNIAVSVACPGCGHRWVVAPAKGAGLKVRKRG